MKPVTPSTITSGTDPRRNAMTGVPAASDSIMTRPNGSGCIPPAPIALVEVQGYAYAALIGAAELGQVVDVGHQPDRLLQRAARLRERFNEAFWDPRGFYVMGIDGGGGQIDSLTTNPGHALWCGIADEDKARRFVERLMDRPMWTGVAP
jgi:glycogen debranching enzyme